MAAGDVYKLSLTASGLGSQYMNVLAFRTIAATDPDQVAWQALADEYKEIMRGNQSNLYSYTTWRAVQVFGSGVVYGDRTCKRSGGRLFAGNFSGNVTGGWAVGEALPPQNSCVITLTTGFIGRRKRGRIYIYGLTEDSQAGGTWDAAKRATWITAFTTFFNKYKDDGTSPTFELGIWSDRTAMGCVWNPITKQMTNVDAPLPDQGFTPATGFQLRTTVFSQRRRTLGAGM